MILKVTTVNSQRNLRLSRERYACITNFIMKSINLDLLGTQINFIILNNEYKMSP